MGFVDRHCFGLAFLSLTAACGGLKMGAAIEHLNENLAPSGPPPRRPTLDERVEELVARQWVDAYYRPATLRTWFEAAARDPSPLVDLTRCLESSARGEADAAACHRKFSAPGDGATARWALPATAPATAEAEQIEIDAERFLANGRALGASLVEFQKSLGSAPLDLGPGIARGARRAANYVGARRWQRGARPATALVIGGGSANGAFAAGFVFRLMEVLSACRRAPSGGCPNARVDLVVGTSTGTLIGALTDLYFTPGRERAAMDLLLESYTCSVEADLYCVPDEYVWKLADDARGVVRFSGVAEKLGRFITPEVENNSLELVGVTVDLGRGAVLGVSDQDPADAMVGCGRRDALLASIVLPVMSEPVNELTLRSGTRRGPFVDGGVASLVPMLEAVQRGAERVVVLSNYPFAPEPASAPRHAFDVLTRTLTLGIVFPGATEPARAELAVVERRMLEYHVCQERFESFAAANTPPSTPEAGESFCRRRRPEATLPRSRSAWRIAATFPEIETSFRSAWVYRPETGVETAQGYAFDPKLMRPLFLLGVATFQERCREMLELLAIDGAVALAACADPNASARIETEFAPLAQCKKRDIPTCEAPIGCDATSGAMSRRR
jgi:predicted acylesterase/phospholipase RssA